MPPINPKILVSKKFLGLVYAVIQEFDSDDLKVCYITGMIFLPPGHYLYRKNPNFFKLHIKELKLGMVPDVNFIKTFPVEKETPVLEYTESALITPNEQYEAKVPARLKQIVVACEDIISKINNEEFDIGVWVPYKIYKRDQAKIKMLNPESETVNEPVN